MQYDWVMIFSSDQIHRVEIVKALLEEEDIICVVVDKRDSLYQIGDYEVLVRKEDEEDAIKVIGNQ